MKNNIFCCDLETTTQAEDCHVWEWGVMSLIDPDNYHVGLTIEECVDCMLSESGTYYFHNLKFDGTFILLELFRRGFVVDLEEAPHQDIIMSEKNRTPYYPKRTKQQSGTIRCIITDDGRYYSLTVRTGVSTIKIVDSLKLIPLSEKQIADKFGLETKKGSIDYEKPRPVGYLPTEEEWDYLRNDILILRSALMFMFDEGIDRLTIGSSSLKWLKDNFEYDWDLVFPEIGAADEYIREAYRGGYCIVNPRYQGQELGYLTVYDKNSMYPWVMREKPLPWGEPVPFEGQYVPDQDYPLYVSRISAVFRVKEGYLPTVQLKHNPNFQPEEYITNSGDEPVILTLTNLDLDLFLEHYNILEIEYIDGYKFMASNKFFQHFVDHWYRRKEEAAKNKDAPGKQISKLVLNNNYGKFGTRLTVGRKIPYMEDGVLKHRTPEKEAQARDGDEAMLWMYRQEKVTRRKGLYLPVAVFVTAWARDCLIRLAQKYIDRFVYCDTDSLHLLDWRKPEGLEVDKYKLGYWDNEKICSMGKFLRAKCYIEKSYDSIHSWDWDVHCAGMPVSCHSHVNIWNFCYGNEFPGKLQHKNVKGGQVLLPITYQLKA